ARLALPLRDLTPHFGLGTVAQGGTALALAVNYFITYGSGPESPGGGASGMDAGAAVLTTMVLGVALAQLAAPPLMRLARRPGPAFAAMGRVDGPSMIPSWVGVVTGFSRAILALAAIAIALSSVIAVLALRTFLRILEHLAGPAVSDVRQLVATIRTEAESLV